MDDLRQAVDPEARDKHIAELEAIGIARPATTPIYYRCSAWRLTTEDSVEVCGNDSNGEVELVLIGWQGRTFVGLGSDHTDRKVENYSVTVSKQMCDKPLAPVGSDHAFHALTMAVAIARQGENYLLTYRPSHRWFYLPEMRAFEALPLKCDDSAQDGRARFVPHTAFKDPTAPADVSCRARVSS